MARVASPRAMRSTSRQFQSVLETFGQNGWHAEPIEGKDVLQCMFDAYHTRVHVLAQVFTQLNAIVIVGEHRIGISEDRYDMLFELIMRSNKSLTLGSFEFDVDRSTLVFKISNIFDREVFDKDAISTMVHAAVAEVDRLSPYVTILATTAQDLLPDLNIERLLLREDVIPPVPGQEEEEL